MGAAGAEGWWGGCRPFAAESSLPEAPPAAQRTTVSPRSTRKAGSTEALSPRGGTLGHRPEANRGVCRAHPPRPEQPTVAPGSLPQFSPPAPQPAPTLSQGHQGRPSSHRTGVLTRRGDLGHAEGRAQAETRVLCPRAKDMEAEAGLCPHLCRVQAPGMTSQGLWGLSAALRCSPFPRPLQAPGPHCLEVLTHRRGGGTPRRHGEPEASLGRPSSPHRLLTLSSLQPAVDSWEPGTVLGQLWEGSVGLTWRRRAGPQQGTQGAPPCWTDNTVSTIPEGLLAEQNQLPLRSRLYLRNGSGSLRGLWGPWPRAAQQGAALPPGLRG